MDCRLVGLGDDTFEQLPAFSPGPAQGGEDKVVRLACGATAALCLFGDPGSASIYQWGTSIYGELLGAHTDALTEDNNIEHGVNSKVSKMGRTAHDGRPFSSKRPKRVQSASLLPPLSLSGGAANIRCLAFGAHFVLAAFSGGGVMTWGGTGNRCWVQGQGQCGACRWCCVDRLTPEVHRTPENLENPDRSPSCSPRWLSGCLGKGGLSVASVAAGDDHAVAVAGDGQCVWAWGRGNCGQLGVGDMSNVNAHWQGSCFPLKVELPPPGKGCQDQASKLAVIAAAACGRDHTALLDAGGRVLTFGSGLHGQLGIGTVGERVWTPTVVDALEGVGTMRPDGTFTGISSIACGAWHTAALSTTGDLYTWGWARFGALGHDSPRFSVPNPAPAIPASDARPMGGGGYPSVAMTATQEVEAGVGTDKGAGSGGDPGPEVVPYPGLAQGLDSLRAQGLAERDDNRLTWVGCGARYTLVLSGDGRAYVLGQVSPRGCPLTTGGGAGPAGGMRAGWHGGMGPGRAPRASPLFEVDLQNLACQDLMRGEGGGVPARGKRDWRVLSAGCGPWYIVLCITGREGGERRGCNVPADPCA
ncbi:unnamed protein product [Discosporangium mesarthrocarpum]